MPMSSCKLWAMLSSKSAAELFDCTAPRYDLTNTILSLGLHHRWRRALSRKVGSVAEGAKVLDVACGTGEQLLSLRRVLPQAFLVGLDCSPEMLRRAYQKCLSSKISLVMGDVDWLPFPDRSFEIITVSFGLRNFANLEISLRELRRVLVPGGRLLVLEFGRPHAKGLGIIYRWYLDRVLPGFGGWLSGQPAAYQYLSKSAANFPCGTELEAQFIVAGWRNINYQRLMSGVVYLYQASA